MTVIQSWQLVFLWGLFFVAILGSYNRITIRHVVPFAWVLVAGVCCYFLVIEYGNFAAESAYADAARAAHYTQPRSLCSVEVSADMGQHWTKTTYKIPCNPPLRPTLRLPFDWWRFRLEVSQ